MSEEKIQELMDYNLEYMEAQQSEEIFGGDYTSAVDLKYANKQIEKLEKAMEEKSSYKDIIIENQQKKIDKQKEVLDKIKEYIEENKYKKMGGYGDNEDEDIEVCLFENDIWEIEELLEEIE